MSAYSRLLAAQVPIDVSVATAVDKQQSFSMGDTDWEKKQGVGGGLLCQRAKVACHLGHPY